MTNIFTNNLGGKVVAVILALGLWLYVASGQSKVIDFPSKIPVNARGVSEGYIAKLSNDEVSIKVAVDRKYLKTLSTDSFDAYVDLTGKTKGTYSDVPITVVSKDSNVEIRQVTPVTITVTIDSAVSKTVPVVAKIEGKPGDGLAPDDPAIEPDKVEVRGAKSDIDQILEATAEIKLNGETTDVKKTVALQGFDASGNVIKGIQFTPDSTVLTVPIVKAGKTKTVGIRVKTTGVVKSGFWASSISVDPNLISITGNAEALSATKYIETEAINIDGLSQNKVYTIGITVPTGIVLVDPITDVKVTINLSGTDTTKEITASINSINLAQTLQLDTSSTEEVKVIVSGPADKLATLSSSDVVVTLDLSMFRTAQTSTKIDLTQDWIKVPSGITIIRFNPSAITISLQSKSS
jgi:YbbR domain-containing protein